MRSSGAENTGRSATLVALVAFLSLTRLSQGSALTKVVVRQTLGNIVVLLPPSDRKNVVYIDGQCGIDAVSTQLTQEIWQAPRANANCYVHHTGEKFTLRRLSKRPSVPPDKTPTTEQVEQSEFTSSSGPYRRVFSRLPTHTVRGYSWMSASVALPSQIDISEVGDDTACVYCGGWGAHGGAVDAGFVHSRGRHDWALFVRREVIPAVGSLETGETFSLKKRFKEGQIVKLTFSVPEDDLVTVTASGADDGGKPINRTLALQMDHQFGWKMDGRSNILKRITTIAQDRESFDRNEKVVGVHWFSPSADNGPCRIGYNWRNNHDWGPSDTARDKWLVPFETWPFTYSGHRVVFVDSISPGEETDAIVLLGAQRRVSQRSAR